MTRTGFPSRLLVAALVGAAWLAASFPSSAATLEVVHAFAKGEGQWPQGGLTVGPDGTFYGTNSEGGRHDGGTVWKLAPDGTLTVLHDFGDVAGDGSWPLARPVLGADGMLYGTTPNGGANQHGIVYRVATDGSRYAIVHTFDPGFLAGAAPSAELLAARDGNLYGVTQIGGDSPQCGSSNGCGTAFRIGRDGSFALLHSFTDAEGALAGTGLVELPDGDLAGVLYSGGVVSTACGGGCGSVYSMTTAGAVTVLHAFTGPDGRLPLGPLVPGAGGRLYGVTRYGGLRKFGAEFSIDASGQFQLGASFNCQHDACRPNVGLGPSPGRYGSTDGLRGSGLVDRNARLVVAGVVATGPLALGPDGSYYGTSNGDSRRGYVFRLQP